MLIEQSFTVNASRDLTADFFADVDRVAACIPGVEGLTELSAGRYAAVLGVRLGPIRAAFQGDVELDLSEAPARFIVTGQGRDRSTGSIAKVHFTADLTQIDGSQTHVSTVADLALRGRMAQFGTGVMRAAAGEMVKHFTDCANAALAADSARSSDPGLGPRSGLRAQDRGAPATPAAPGLLRIVVRGVRTALVGKVKRWCARMAARLGSRR